MNKYEFIKYKNYFSCHSLKTEEMTDNNKMFLCFNPNGIYESWYRVIFQNYRIIVDGDFDHFILRINDKESLEWLLKIHNDFSENINLYSEKILEYIPVEDFSDYVEFCPKKAKKLFRETETRIKDHYQSINFNNLIEYYFNIKKKDENYYKIKDELKDKIEHFRISIVNLKNDFYKRCKIDSKEFCEEYNEIIKYYFKPFSTAKITEEKVNKYIDKCYSSVAALLKFSDLYLKNQNLDVA